MWIAKPLTSPYFLTSTTKRIPLCRGVLLVGGIGPVPNRFLPHFWSNEGGFLLKILARSLLSVKECGRYLCEHDFILR